EQLVSADAAGTIRVWGTASGQPLQTLTGHTGQAFSVVFHPDGQRLASAGSDGTVRVWDAAGGRELRSLKGHGEGDQARPVTGVRFSPAGGGLAWGGEDRPVRGWEVAPGRNGSPSGATTAGFIAWPSARTAAGWPRAVTTTRYAFGTRSPGSCWAP